MSETQSIYAWQDRRVDTGHETAEALAKRYNRDNWRLHPEAQRLAVEESIETLGWVGQVKVNRASGNLIDGHLRVELALFVDPQMQLPVDYYELSEEEEALALAALDSTTEMAEPDREKLNRLMERAKGMLVDKPKLTAMLTGLKERAGLNGGEPETAGKDTPPMVDKAAELQVKWGTEVGQLWRLGRHRLICGDCTDRAVVERVMDGERAEMVFTSPPYNRGTTTGGGFNDKSLSQQLTNGYEGYNDNLPKEKYYEWQAILLNQWWSIISDDGVIYYNHRPRVQNGVYETPLDWNPGLPVRQVVIWNSGGGINFAPTHYRPSCEWIVIFAKPSFRLTSKSMSGYGDVWDIPVAEDRWGHPAPFPIALPERALETTSSIIIYEPFLGSGTTLIACENLGRRCRAIELSPVYIAVALERWSQHTGQEPELVK